MPESDPQPVKRTKGELTAERIMDVAEGLFARQGYEGTSLRQIANGAGIREPGLYNHFSSKEALYEAVLYRALNPMANALSEHLEQASGLRDYTDLPSIMTDRLAEHPHMAALFVQALQGDEDSTGTRMMQQWLDQLFTQGLDSMRHFGSGQSLDRETLAINAIGLFNLTAGFFLSQRAFASMAEGELDDPDNIARQKQLLHKVIRALLVG